MLAGSDVLCNYSFFPSSSHCLHGNLKTSLNLMSFFNNLFYFLCKKNYRPWRCCFTRLNVFNVHIFILPLFHIPIPSLHPRILPSKNPSCLFYDMQMAEWRLSFKLSGPSVNMPVLFPRLFARALGSRSRLREGYQLARSNIAFLSARERGGPCERADVLSCPPHSRCFGLWVCLVRDKREPERIPRP